MARSSARPVILLSRSPASSSTSNWAITGPVWISTTRTWKPKSRKVFSRILALRRTSFSCSSKQKGSPGNKQVRCRAARNRAASPLGRFEVLEHFLRRRLPRRRDPQQRGRRLPAGRQPASAGSLVGLLRFAGLALPPPSSSSSSSSSSSAARPAGNADRHGVLPASSS